MQLFLVTINYNGSSDTIALLQSLQQQTDTDFYTIIVDNASTPDEYVVLDQAQNPPHIRILRNEKNLGFSGGNNVGIRDALEKGAEWILLINNDTHVEPNFIKKLRQQLEGKQGVLGLPIQEGDQTAYAGRMQWLRPTLSHLYKPVVNTSQVYAIGAGIMIHKDVFLKIGLLDERYFLYFEDADFSATAHSAGIPVSFIQEPKIHHQISQSTSKLGSPLLLRYHYRNMFLFNQKHAPGYIKIALLPWAFLGIVKQLLKLAFVPSQRPYSRAIIKGITAYLRGEFGKINP